MPKLGPPSSQHLRDVRESLRREIEYARDEVTDGEVAAMRTVMDMIARLLVTRQQRADQAYRDYPGRPG